MPRNVIILLAVFLVLSCQEATVDLEQVKNELMQTDREFSAMSVEQGMQAAFGAYMVDEVVIYRAGSLPIRGRAEALPLYPDRTDIVLEWEPFFADAAASGDLGYTLGNYTLTVPGDSDDDSDDDSDQPVVSRGSYVSIWKRQADGSWKFVFDAGHQGPAEEPTEP